MTDTVLDSELPARSRRKLITPVTAGLGIVVLVALGFTGGVLVQKSSGATATPAAATGARPSFARGGGQGAPGGGGGGAQPTVGTVSSKDGRTLYVKGTDGTTVKVRLDANGKVTRTAKASVKAIHPGDTVFAQGTTSASGTVKAASVTATASGAQGAGGGGGRGFGGFAPRAGG
jgi:hypothetical protein